MLANLEPFFNQLAMGRMMDAAEGAQSAVEALGKLVLTGSSDLRLTR